MVEHAAVESTFVEISSLAGKPASENPAKSVKPKYSKMYKATPSKECESLVFANLSILCVETLHGAPKSKMIW